MKNSLLSIRNSYTSHAFARLGIREERTYWGRISYYAVVYIVFAFLDVLTIPNQPYYLFFLIRASAPSASALLYYLSRSRLRYGARSLLAGLPYMWVIQFVMMKYELQNTLYLAGLVLAMLIYTTMFSSKWKVAFVVNSVHVAPLLIQGIYWVLNGRLEGIGLAWMCVAAALVATMVSDQLYNDLLVRFRSQEQIRRTLGDREKEVRDKAHELTRRKMFERQFSPQVVRMVLDNPVSMSEPKQYKVTTIVIDIEDSTKKADALDPQVYCEVIEEVIDVFAACCLKFNVTLDKFTGDGYMAFSGAPVESPMDFRNAVLACLETISMLKQRKDFIEQRWQGEFNIRIAANESYALVGFLGNGAIRSFSAIGKGVTLAYRLVSATPAWTIALHSSLNSNVDLGFLECSVQGPVSISDLKGFGQQKFSIYLVSKSASSEDSESYGRCEACGTPLVMNSGITGIPSIACPACVSIGPQRQAA